MLFAPKPQPFSSPEEHGDQLKAIPGRNELAKLIQEEEGRYVILEVELKYSGVVKLLAKALKARRRKRIQLDGLSLEMYKMIDGVCNVEEIIETWMDKYKLSFFEARSLCLYYLQNLSGNGIIALGIPKEEVVIQDE